MKHLLLSIAIVSLLLPLAQAEDAASPIAVTAHLRDGSRLTGHVADRKVAIVTDYARIEVPLSRLTLIVFGDDLETASLTAVNGDVLKGVLDFGELTMDSLIGKVVIAPSLLVKLTVKLPEPVAAK